MRALVLSALLFATLLVPLGARAGMSLAETEFVERYAGASGASPTSGSILVSLQMEGDGLFSPNELGAFVGRLAGEKACVRLMTADGRYWALNGYRSSGDTSRPEMLPFPSSYLDQLVRYRAGDIMLRISLSPECDEDRFDRLAVGMVNADPGWGARRLRAYLNIPRTRVRFSLTGKDGTSLTEGGCDPSNTGRLAYTHVCDLGPMAAIENLEGELKFSIRFRTGGVEDVVYTIPAF